jgi:hypothetical protein
LPENFLGEGCTRGFWYFVVIVVIAAISVCIEHDWGKEQTVGLSPHAQAIRTYMESLEDQGYEVNRLIWGDEDPDHRTWLLISYEVTDPSTQETYLYNWAVKLPTQYYLDHKAGWITLLPEECECAARSEAAEAFRPYMDDYLPDWYKELLHEPDEE